MKDRAYEIARNREYDGYQRALLYGLYMVLIRKQDQEEVYMNNQLKDYINQLLKNSKEEKSF